MRLAIALTCAGCSFQTHPAAGDGRAPDAPADGSAMIDAPIDAAPEVPYMLACTIDTLYQLDVDTHTPTLIGSIGDNMDAIAGVPALLYGIPSSTDHLLTIDSLTGSVIAMKNLSPNKPYYGLTYVPSPPRWLAGSGESSGGSLYSIDPALGKATAIGSFGQGLYVAGDIAWVEGKGLYGTFYGPGCSDTCIASIDPATGAATVLSYNAPVNLLSASGFRGQLWALDTSGRVFTVDTTTGDTTFAFTTGVPWADAAQ